MQGHQNSRKGKLQYKPRGPIILLVCISFSAHDIRKRIEKDLSTNSSKAFEQINVSSYTNL